MKDTPPSAKDRAEQQRVHAAVSRLRVHLAALGLPPDQVSQILPVSDIKRRHLVRLGTLTVDSAETVLALLDAGARAKAEATR